MLASLFPAIALTHGQHVDLDWPEFVARYLSRHEVRHRKDGRLFSFAVYQGDPQRSDTNVRAMTGIVIDIDNKVGEGNDAHCSATPTIPEHHFDNLGDITYAWYSTHQNTADWPRWRLVFPLDREVQKHEWPAVFDGALAMLGRDENIDPTCGDLSRAYYTPSCSPACEASAFAGYHEGRLCSVDELLSMTAVVIGDNVHTLPGVDQRNPGRNNRLKAIAAAMLGRMEPVEAIVIELLKVDAEHNPPLFTDRSEGFGGSAEAGALKFLGNIALSNSARSKQAGGAPDALYLRGPGETTFVRPPEGESMLALVGDITETLTAPQWLVRKHFEFQTLGVLFGEPGAGKSFIALDLGLSVAAGRVWHGHKVRQTPVIYICGEGFAGLQRRAWAWKDWHQVDFRGIPFAITKHAVPMLNPRAVEMLCADVDRIVDQLGDAPGLFVIDTLARNFGGADENATKDMNAFVERVTFSLMNKFSAGALVVHHTGHGDKTRARGASSLHGAVDAEYCVSRQADGTVELKCIKLKDAPEPDPMRFSMRVVDLPLRDDEGETVTSVVPVAVAAAPVPPMVAARRGAPRGMGDVQRACLDVLVRLLGERRATLQAGGFDPLRARVNIKEWQQASIEARAVTDRKRFFDRRESLEAAGLVRTENGFAYPIQEGADDGETS